MPARLCSTGATLVNVTNPDKTFNQSVAIDYEVG